MKVIPEILYWSDLGRVDYSTTWQLQDALRTARMANEIGNTVLFVEHNPVVTVGKQKASIEDLDIEPEDLKDHDIDLVYSNRGGRLTYHGPGQLVVYFIFDLQSMHTSIKPLVCLLENCCLYVLQHFGVCGEIREGAPGVWVKDHKIGFVGLHVARGITTHGISLNISSDLSGWAHFIPCGIQDRKITSLELECKKSITLESVREVYLKAFEHLFRKGLEEIDPQTISLISEKVGVRLDLSSPFAKPVSSSKTASSSAFSASSGKD